MANEQKSSNGDNFGFEAKLFLAADKLRGSMVTSEYKQVVLGLVFLKYISDAFNTVFEKLQADEHADEEDAEEYLAERTFWVPKEARWGHLQANAKQPTIGKLVDDAMLAIEKSNASLKGVLPSNYAQLILNNTMLGELIDLISTIGMNEESEQSKEILGRVYEHFLRSFAGAEGKRGGEYLTPPSIVSLLTGMLEPYKGRVYDPCCGSGGMFVQSEKFVVEQGGSADDLRFFGQELNNAAWQLAKMNMAVRGIDADIKWNNEGSFHKDELADLKADFILANPPFNISDWGGDRLREDVRWKYGTPPASNANYGWLQHIVHHLAPNGTAGVVLANGSMSSNLSGEGDIRQSLIEHDLVDCMVALPGALFYSTTIPACLWFLAKNKNTEGFRNRKGEVLFIDARKLGSLVDRTRRELSDEDVARISDTYHAWRGEEHAIERRGEYEDVSGFCYSASLEDISANDYDLNINRYMYLSEGNNFVTGEVAEERGLKAYLLGEHFDILECKLDDDEFKFPFDKSFGDFTNDYCLLNLYDDEPRAFDSYDSLESTRYIAFHVKDTTFQAEYLTEFINSDIGGNFVSEISSYISGHSVSKLDKRGAGRCKIYLPKPEIQYPSLEFDRFDFEFEKLENELRLCCFGEPVLTGQGTDIRSKQESMLENLVSELEGFESCRLRNQRIIKLGGICFYSLYSDMVDIIAKQDPILENFDGCLHSDSTFYRSAGPEQVDQMGRWAGIFRMLDKRGILQWEDKDSLWVEDYPVLLSDWGGLEGEEAEEVEAQSKLSDDFLKSLNEVYSDLSDSQKSSVLHMYIYHNAGLMLPLALVTENCTPNEYADGLMAAHAAHQKIFSSSPRAHTENFRRLKEDARTMMSYIKEVDSEEIRVSNLLKAGESDFVEFKSSLRYNLHSDKFDDKITQACLKAIAGYLNKDGGALFIGVNDDGDVVGLEKDTFQNEDKFLLHLKDKIGKVLGEYALSKLSFSFLVLNDKSFCEVVVARSENPIYMRIGNAEDFCIRTGPSTTTLSASQIHPYIADHFKA
jgi:type I restriction enzyme M protein